RRRPRNAYHAIMGCTRVGIIRYVRGTTGRVRVCICLLIRVSWPARCQGLSSNTRHAMSRTAVKMASFFDPFGTDPPLGGAMTVDGTLVFRHVVVRAVELAIRASLLLRQVLQATAKPTARTWMPPPC
ncbi:unnamed protein product, partial [Ectocarpus sp. 12 AP-2014]